jgi:PKD repeat protein
MMSNKSIAQFHDNTTILGFLGASTDFFLGLPDDSLDHTVLTFNNGNLNVELKKYLGIDDIWHTNTPYSDINGKFIFFSNGLNVWNNKFEFIEKDSVFTKPKFNNSWHQFNLALPMPKNENKTFLIYGNDAEIRYPTSKIDSVFGGPIDSGVIYSKNLFYAEINNSGIGGISEFQSKGNKIIEDSISIGKFTACRHANGRDWWILIPRFGRSNTYHKLLLNNKGLHYNSKQSIGKLIDDGVGEANFSPNGKIYVRYDSYRLDTPASIDIYDFDRCTGALSNSRRIVVGPAFGGIAISPNSRFLYYSAGNKVYQYDLQAQNIAISGIVIANYDGYKGIEGNNTNFYRLQLMPDRRIYCNTHNSNNYMHIIQKPDLPAPFCRFEQHILKLPARNFGSIPNFPNYRLGPIDGSVCDTLGINNFPQAWYRYEKDTLNKLKVEFTDLSFYEPKEWSWDFGDGSLMSKDTSPVHIFSKKANYKVCLTVKNENGTHTHCKNINFGTTSTQDAYKQDFVQVSPNPFSNKLYIALSEILSQPIFHLYDTTGRLIKSQTLYYGITEMETSLFSSGLYLWNVSSQNEIIASGKVVKVE